MSGSSGMTPGCYLLEDLERHLDASERRAHLYSLDELFHLREHLAGDRHTLGKRGFLSFFLRLPHALQYFGGHRHARHLVRQKLGVAERDEGPDAGDDRRLELLDALQKRFELARVEHRLRNRELRSRVHLPR